jgi:putative transposase
LTGKLQVVGGVERKNHDVDSSSGFISSIDSLPEKYKLDFEFKIKLIKWLQKCGVSRGRRKLVDENIKKFFELHPDIKVKRPSASAVMGWMREWEISNNNPACLISKISNASELPIYLISLNKKFRKF